MQDEGIQLKDGKIQFESLSKSHWGFINHINFAQLCKYLNEWIKKL